MIFALWLLLAVPSFAVTTVTIATPAIAKAGVVGSITLTATVTGPAGTIAWTHVSGPGAGTFGASTSLSTTYTAPTRSTTTADYVVTATYTNSDGATTSLPMHVGAVLVDANDVVITGDAAADKLLGPLTRLGAAPWPYFDIADQALASTIMTAALANPPTLGAAYSGTVQVLSNGITQASLVGTGTSFLSEMADGDEILIAWNTVDGAGTGRHWDTVYSRSDNTHLVLGTFQTQIDLASGLTVYRMPSITATFQPFWWCIPCGNSTPRTWNYYDVVLAGYRLFYRTGILSYLTQARQFADLWWQWGIDHGRAGMPPRYTSLQSQFLRALDGKSNRFPDLKTMADNFKPGGAVSFVLPSTTTNLGTTFDAREAGYATWFQALGALSDTDVTRHAAYCLSLTGTMVSPWILHQHPDGYWSEDLFHQGNYFYIPPGNSPWRTDIPIHGLQSSYEALIDTTSAGCNSTALAASLLSTITAAVSWTYNAGRSNPSLGGNGGVHYDAAFETNGQIGIPVAGTVSVNLSSSTVTGSGTSFVSVFGSTGTKYIFFDGSRTGYKVINSASNFTLTISPAFGSQGELANITAGVYYGANQAFTTCASTATYCWDYGSWPPAPPNGDRNLVRLMPGMTGWLYYHTGNTLYKTWGDAWFSNAFGGPGNGPGGTDPCVGAGCDGAETDVKSSLPGCAITPNPPAICNKDENYAGGNVYGPQGLGKNYGQASGAPGAPNYLAYRLLAPIGAPARSITSGRSSFRGNIAIR